MRRKNVSELIKELDQRLEEISEKPPAELRNLNDVSSIPGMHRYSRILCAHFLLSRLSYFLGTLKSSAKKGVSLDSIIIITKTVFERDSIFATAYGLTETTQLLKKTSEVLDDVQDVNDYVEVSDRVRIYLSKIAQVGWIDTLFMHSAKMELAYDLMFPPGQNLP